MSRFAGNAIPKAKEDSKRISDFGLGISDFGLSIRSGFYLQMSKMLWFNGIANMAIVCKRVIF